ncbi:hypothetical protein INT47_010768, partial [Mucor saturninus]
NRGFLYCAHVDDDVLKDKTNAINLNTVHPATIPLSNQISSLKVTHNHLNRQSTSAITTSTTSNISSTSTTPTTSNTSSTPKRVDNNNPPPSSQKKKAFKSDS